MKIRCGVIVTQRCFGCYKGDCVCFVCEATLECKRITELLSKKEKLNEDDLYFRPHIGGKRVKNYWEEALELAFSVADKEGKTIICAGDWFDSENISIKQVNLLYDKLNLLFKNILKSTFMAFLATTIYLL